MPTHPRTIERLGRFALTTLAYAFGVALVALALPTMLAPIPAVFLPKPTPVVTRAPVEAPPMAHRS